jgi:hypothetical protein
MNLMAILRDIFSFLVAQGIIHEIVTKTMWFASEKASVHSRKHNILLSIFSEYNAVKLEIKTKK